MNKKYSYSTMGENNETVLVGQSDGKSLTRRDFLKVAGGTGLAAFLAACGVTVPEGSKTIEFREVQAGQTVDLILPGELNPTPVVIEYPPHSGDFTPLQIRQDVNNHDTFLSFTDNATTSRKMAEVTSQQVFRVAANPALAGTDIHTYPSAVTEMGAAGRSVLPPNQDFFILKVVTRLSDYIGDHKPEVEHNGHQWGSNPVEDFGIGAYTGTLEKIDGKMTFRGGAFVQDLRALVPAPAK